MLVGPVYLNKAMDEVSESDARYRLERDDRALHIYAKRTNGEWLHATPYAFGAVFSGRSIFSTDNIQKIRRFLIDVADPYDVFPYEREIKHIQQYGPDEIGVEISAETARTFIDLYMNCFPIFWRYPVNQSTCIVYDGFYGAYLAGTDEPYYSAPTYRALAEEVFGVARKDTLRGLRDMNEDQVSVAAIFKGLLPAEVILSSLSNCKVRFFDHALEKDKYQALERLSQPIIRRLLEDIISTDRCDAVLIRDSLEMLAEVDQEQLKRLKGVKTWLDLHERVMHLVQLSAGEEGIIRIPEQVKKLSEEPSVSGLSLVPLMRAGEFIGVGAQLDICLGTNSYFTKARNGESYCLVGLLDNEAKVAIEVAEVDGRWVVLQYRGFKNEQPKDSKEEIARLTGVLNTEVCTNVTTV